MKKFIKNKIILAALVAIVFPFVSYADTYSYGSGDYYSYDTPSYSSGDYYSYDDSYSSGDYYGYDTGYNSGDYYSYDTPSYSSGDYYSYDDSYSSGDYYSYDDYYSSGDYYSYDTPSYSSGDFYSYEDVYSQDTNVGYYPEYNDLSYAQDYYSAYQDSYYYDDYGYDDNYYYDDDYYYDYDYYGGDCTSNCGGGYHPRPQHDDLDVVCSVSDRTIEEGDSVTFTADADGGRGSYTYRWSGDVSGTGRSVTERFNNSGTYHATVRVTDRDGDTATANCGSVRVEDTDNDDEDFDVSCKVSDTSIEEGDTVRFTAEVDGGDSPYEYDWTGDVNEDERTFTKRFNNSGRYEVSVRVTDDEGRIARDTCSVIRVSDDDRSTHGVFSSNTFDYPTGNLASVGSVYLNQIPYTGPEDTAKGIAFVVGILAWSIAGALIIQKKMNKKAVANRIEAFKNSNRTTIA